MQASSLCRFVPVRQLKPMSLQSSQDRCHADKSGLPTAEGHVIRAEGRLVRASVWRNTLGMCSEVGPLSQTQELTQIPTSGLRVRSPDQSPRPPGTWTEMQGLDWQATSSVVLMLAQPERDRDTPLDEASRYPLPASGSTPGPEAPPTTVPGALFAWV